MEVELLMWVNPRPLQQQRFEFCSYLHKGSNQKQSRTTRQPVKGLKNYSGL